MSLKGSSRWVSDGEWDWVWIFGSSGVVDIIEGSVDGHLEVVISVDLGVGLHLSVIGGDSSELWDSDVSSIFPNVLVNGGIDTGFNSALDGLDDVWDDSALKVWDESSSNLGCESTGKGDINIIWVNVNLSFLNLKLWCHLSALSNLLKEIDLDIDRHLVDLDGSLSGNSDPVGIGEVG